MASEPQAVPTSQTSTSAGPYGVSGESGSSSDSAVSRAKNTTALVSITIMSHDLPDLRSTATSTRAMTSPAIAPQRHSSLVAMKP